MKHVLPVALFMVLSGDAYAQERSFQDHQRQQHQDYLNQQRYESNRAARQGQQDGDGGGDALGNLFFEILKMQAEQREQEQIRRQNLQRQQESEQQEEMQRWQERAAYQPSETQSARSKIKSFLEDYHEAAENSTRDLGRFYAREVDYGNKGIVSRSYIMREKAEVEEVCPGRRYRVDYGNMELRQTEDDDVYDVYFDVDTECFGGKKNTRRVWATLLRLSLAGGSPSIVGARGQAK